MSENGVLLTAWYVNFVQGMHLKCLQQIRKVFYDIKGKTWPCLQSSALENNNNYITWSALSQWP